MCGEKGAWDTAYKLEVSNGSDWDGTTRLRAGRHDRIPIVGLAGLLFWGHVKRVRKSTCTALPK